MSTPRAASSAVRQHEVGAGPVVMAFDVGGTDIKSALVDAQGRVLALRRTPTPRDADEPARAVVAEVGRLAAEQLAMHPGVRPEAVGLSVPGLVDSARGVARFSSNLGWTDVPMRALAENALRLPIAFGHDVLSAGDAEHRLGAARGYDDVVVLAIGTGISGSIMLGGRLHSGGGSAGELGHCLADPDGDPCPCGATGCLETIASAGAIARRYGAESGRPVTGAREVLEAALAGDPIAHGVWERALAALAEQLARLAAILAPEAIVIGGGLAEAGPALFSSLADRLDRILSFHRRPALVPAALGDDAGLLGTALSARDLVESIGGRR